MNALARSWQIGAGLCLLYPLSLTAADTGITVSGIVGKVQYQHPGIDGYPSALQLLVALFANHPRDLSDSVILVDGDTVLGADQNSRTQLVCPNGGTQTLIGAFNATITVGSNGSRCKLTLRSGTGVATTPGGTGVQQDGFPVEIEAGEVTLGARSTQFGATVVSGANSESPKSDAFVVEGTVDVAQRATSIVIQVRSGQQLPSAATATQLIPQDTYVKLASSYAAIDTVKLPPADQSSARERLNVAYLAALQRPTDADAQNHLVSTYQAVSVNSPALAYRRQYTQRLRTMTEVAPNLVNPPVNATPVNAK